jgi:hypothetical protein
MSENSLDEQRRELMAAKEPFESAYAAPDATTYYRAYAATRLSIVEYCAELVRAANELNLTAGPVVDLGCGYGTLGTLLRGSLGVEGVYSAHLGADPPEASNLRGRGPVIVGVDRSPAALRCAEHSHSIDRSIELDFDAQPEQIGNHGPEAIATCSAVLGYVRPVALRAALDVLRPRLAFITCVTWLVAELRDAFQDSECSVEQLNTVPLFQRWATAGEEARMPGALLEGAHRADCFLLSRGTAPTDVMADRVEQLRERRSGSLWLGAGRPGGCELTPGRA